jgi:hypothetical protein
MATKHGTRHRYNDGCRCEDCTAANAAYQQRWRKSRIGAEPTTPGVVVTVSSPVTPGPVEAAVNDEIGGLAADARPGLAQTALALARIMDNPKAVNQQPAAAKVLAALLEKLHSASARGRRGSLSVVRSMTKEGGA